MSSTPFQISYHGVAHSPALTGRVTEEVAKLGQFFDRITFCRVVIDRPNHRHRHGDAYAIHIEIGVPRQRIAVHHDPPPARDPYCAVHEAFSVARRRLEDYARRLRSG